MFVVIEAFEKPDGFDMPDEFMEKIKIAETTENKQTTSQGELYSLETVINSKGERYYELLEKEEALKYTWHIAGRYMLFEDLMLVVGVCEIAVSYTHLDVYKRQSVLRTVSCPSCSTPSKSKAATVRSWPKWRSISAIPWPAAFP